jgi:hypothetical protein
MSRRERTWHPRAVRIGEVRGWLAAAVAVTACACTSSGTVAGPAEDASTDATVVPIADGSMPVDSATPDASSDDTGAPDAGADADAGPIGDAGCTWDGFVESPACSTCLRTVCCGVTQACETDPACAALDTCVNNCSTTGGGDAGSVSDCDQACADSQTQAVRDEYQTWTQCVDNSCGAGTEVGPCL